MFIIATISKNSYAPEKIEEILRAGARGLRFNLSHNTPDEATDHIHVARGVIEKMDLTQEVKILADLPGAKIRIGEIPGNEYVATKGELITFKSGSATQSVAEFFPINLPRIATMVQVGQRFTLADGEIGFEIIEIIDENTFRAKALNAWTIPHLKGVNIGHAIDSLDHITEKTEAHIRNLKNIKPDWVAISFVNSADHVLRVKSLIQEHLDYIPPIVAKLESPKAIEQLENIMQYIDIAMVARGDLGLTLPIEQLGMAQKKIIQCAKKYNKQVIVATQLLESLLHYYTPVRAEVLDITNCVLDGVDAIMFGRETGLSLTPGYSVEVAKRIIDHVESGSGN